ncbi:MAG: hypothetical protein J6V06_05200, partial [Clostridia bacterium]|nr:hypothetical protein [Clostridia bacterium]
RDLEKYVDSLIVIPNERLKLLGDKSLSVKDAFSKANDVLWQGVKSISDTIKVPGYINLDFADIKSVMKDAGRAHMGIGRGRGADCAAEATKQAITSPLLETAIDGASGVIINVTCSSDMSLDMIEQAGALISDASHPDANIIFGSVFDEDMGDEMLITVIATGFGGATQAQAAPSATAQTAPATAPEFISQAAASANDTIFGSMSKEAVDFASTKFGQSFVSIFEQAAAAANGKAPAAPVFPEMPLDPVPAAPVAETPAAPAKETQAFDVIETPAKKSGSIFDDPDEDESDVLPVFKGRNIFGNN